MNESTLQRNIVKTFRIAYNKYSFCFFAIENKRKTKTGAQLKAQGIISGVADLCLALPTKNSGALYIELKFGKNKQSQTQKIWQQEIIKHGNTYCVAYNLVDAFDIIIPYIKEHELWKLQNSK